MDGRRVDPEEEAGRREVPQGTCQSPPGRRPPVGSSGVPYEPVEIVLAPSELAVAYVAVALCVSLCSTSLLLPGGLRCLCS